MLPNIFLLWCYSYFSRTEPSREKFDVAQRTNDGDLTNIQFVQGRLNIGRTTIFIFSFCIGLVTQLNGSSLEVLKRHYITKRIRELLIGN